MARVSKKPKVENIGRKNAVIYARYSSSFQSEQSIEGQLRENTEFAEKNGYTIVDTYIDRAMSGKSDDRPAFQKMVKDSANGTFDYVIVYKFDRFSRNRYDSAINKKILQENNVDNFNCDLDDALFINELVYINIEAKDRELDLDFENYSYCKYDYEYTNLAKNLEKEASK